jgi:hypothetical protein
MASSNTFPDANPFVEWCLKGFTAGTFAEYKDTASDAGTKVCSLLLSKSIQVESPLSYYLCMNL